MKVILVSTPDKFKSEVEIVIDLFDQGLEAFHLRKPRFSARKMASYLRKIPKKYHDRIVIHSHYHLALRYKLKGIHLGKRDRNQGFRTDFKIWWYRMRHSSLAVSTSVHSLLSLLEDQRKYNYVILSPVFNSSSKLGFNSSFGEDQLRKTIIKSRHTVYALGGVIPERIDEMKRIGFSGAVLSGLLWELEKESDPIEVFSDFVAVAEGRKSLIPKVEIKPVKIDLKERPS